MFRSLNTRLLISYILVILVCLTLVGLGLFLFVRTSALWNRPTQQRLEEAERETVRLLQGEALRTLPRERIYNAMARIAKNYQVRILLLDNRKTVRLDTDDDWTGTDLSQMIRLPSQVSREQGMFTAPDGRQWLYIAQVPPGIEEQRQILVFASRPVRLLALAWFADNLLRPLAQAGLVALVLSILLALISRRSVSKPLQRVASAAEGIARGESGTRAPVSGPAEVRALAHSFNQMANQVEAAQRSQRDFVANVSHELKTPLTSIQGFSQALLDGAASTPEATTRAARVIHSEAERMRRMVDELLILARFDAGQMKLARAPVEISPLLQSCIEKLAPQAQATQVALELDAPEQLTVTGDTDRLAQVFTNLLDNGVAHTPAGGKVTVAARLLAAENAIEVTVTDTGEGIPAEALSRIFERFYQVDKARSRTRKRSQERGRGAGLGLAIAKEVVEAHGGSIVAESVEGLGSKFSVRLPAQKGGSPTHPSAI
ncbi:MAG: HAMP domain-containing protein [Anaerolineae bacterium]|nr:HAMP domain-containing protein [Anaerolineae bacterium]